MTAPKRTFAVALVVLGVALAGCGGDKNGKPIPAATASALAAELERVQARLDQGSAGACKDILEGPRDPDKSRVQELIDAMPDRVDQDVRSALQDSFDNLWDRVDDRCQEISDQAKPKPSTETDTAPTETNTTETNTTETNTTETNTTESTPTSPDEAPLPNDGNGNGNGALPGAGNGNGNGTGDGGGAGPSGAAGGVG